MTDEQSHIRVIESNDVRIVEFLDRKVLEEFTINQIGDQITDLVDQLDKPKMLVSFEQVDHLSSAALGILIKLQDRVTKRGGVLRLSDIRPQILEVFKITQLTKIFNIHDTRDDALRSFQS
ncbi:MAG: STAS domain-containing protein [Phycisphaerae bacterium]